MFSFDVQFFYKILLLSFVGGAVNHAQDVWWELILIQFAIET